MRNRVFSWILLLQAIAFPQVAAAQEWSQVVSIEYAMGDNEARATARQAALEELKRKAASAAGTYVQSTTTLLESGELKESVSMIGASIVRLTDVQESLAVEGENRLVLRVTARAIVDEKALKDRIRALHEDADKAKHIHALQEENENLRAELRQIRTELAGEMTAARAAELLERLSIAYDRLAENERKVVAVFERGTLLHLADASRAELERRLSIVGSAFERLVQGAHISAKIDRVFQAPGAPDMVLVDIVAEAQFWRSDVEEFIAATKDHLTVTIRNRYGPSLWPDTIISPRWRMGSARDLEAAVFACLETMGARAIYQLGSASETRPLFTKIRMGSDHAYLLRGVGTWRPQNMMNVNGTANWVGPERFRLTISKAEAATLSEVSATLSVKGWQACL